MEYEIPPQNNDQEFAPDEYSSRLVTLRWVRILVVSGVKKIVNRLFNLV